ncbi:hypothetical protein CDAR_168971 [Caerostris darwini]|uniref:Uncharacterized protein n=1 Tax=Caerostris darwini TaxID=1538125 RepID=A0AAV4WQF8_9ARAC|nr:hypothetical protein CDAR_168971 [Caerostris darwini]
MVAVKRAGKEGVTDSEVSPYRGFYIGVKAWDESEIYCSRSVGGNFYAASVSISCIVSEKDIRRNGCGEAGGTGGSDRLGGRGGRRKKIREHPSPNVGD